MSSTRVSCHVNAPRARVYRALIDPSAIATWMVPAGMTSQVHAFGAREGGLVPNERVVEVVEFETADPALRGEMTITITLTDAASGTDVIAVHDGLPSGLPAADNEAGWRSSLAKLAALVEGRLGNSTATPD